MERKASAASPAIELVNSGRNPVLVLANEVGAADAVVPAERILIEKCPDEAEHQGRTGKSDAENPHMALATTRRSSLEGAERKMRHGHAGSTRAVHDEQTFIECPQHGGHENGGSEQRLRPFQPRHH